MSSYSPDRMLRSENFRKFLKRRGYDPSKMDPEDEQTESLFYSLSDEFLDLDLDF